MAAHCSSCVFMVCVCSLLTAVCVHLDGLNAEQKFWVWDTILASCPFLSLCFTFTFIYLEDTFIQTNIHLLQYVSCLGIKKTLTLPLMPCYWQKLNFHLNKLLTYNCHFLCWAIQAVTNLKLPFWVRTSSVQRTCHPLVFNDYFQIIHSFILFDVWSYSNHWFSNAGVQRRNGKSN